MIYIVYRDMEVSLQCGVAGPTCVLVLGRSKVGERVVFGGVVAALVVVILEGMWCG